MQVSREQKLSINSNNPRLLTNPLLPVRESSVELPNLPISSLLRGETSQPVTMPVTCSWRDIWNVCSIVATLVCPVGCIALVTYVGSLMYCAKYFAGASCSSAQSSSDLNSEAPSNISNAGSYIGPNIMLLTMLCLCCPNVVHGIGETLGRLNIFSHSSHKKDNQEMLQLMSSVSPKKESGI